MTAKEKAEQLISNMSICCKTKINAKLAAMIVCNEIIYTKNYEDTLHPDFIEFHNSYWKYVIEEIQKL